LTGRPEGNRPLGRPNHKWEDNIGIDFKEIGWEGVDWILLGHDRDWLWAVVDMVMKLQVP
jgi:hypothetical protein